MNERTQLIILTVAGIFILEYSMQAAVVLESRNMAGSQLYNVVCCAIGFGLCLSVFGLLSMVKLAETMLRYEKGRERNSKPKSSHKT